MSILHDVLSLTAVLGLLALVRQRRGQSRRSGATQPAAGPPDVSLLDLTRRQLIDWRGLLDESQANCAWPEQVDYCRRQVSRFEADVGLLDGQVNWP